MERDENIKFIQQSMIIKRLGNYIQRLRDNNKQAINSVEAIRHEILQIEVDNQSSE